MHSAFQVTDVRQVVLDCPQCGTRVSFDSEDRPKHAPYCSVNCQCAYEGLRLCTACRELHPGESFQPAPGFPKLGIVCEACAAICGRCNATEGTLVNGTFLPDPSLLSETGECRFCEAKRLAHIAWGLNPRSVTAMRLVELLDDLAPEPKSGEHS